MYGINSGEDKCTGSNSNITSTPCSRNNVDESLHGACIRGDLELLKILIDKGANLYETDEVGYTALQLASAHGHVDIVKELLKFKATDVDAQDHIHGNTSVHEAAWNGFSRTLTELIKSGADVNILNQNSFSPLHLAAQNGHNESARILLYAGCNPDIQNGYGDTAMHTSSRYGHAGVTRILISARACVNIQNRNGDTPLHISVALKQKKITNLLIGAGVDVSALNYQRENALDIARRKNYEELVNMLTENLRMVHLTDLKAKQQEHYAQSIQQMSRTKISQMPISGLPTPSLPAPIATTTTINAAVRDADELKGNKGKPKKWLWFMKKNSKQKSNEQQQQQQQLGRSSTQNLNNLNVSQSLPTSPDKSKTPETLVNPENILHNFQKHQISQHQQKFINFNNNNNNNPGMPPMFNNNNVANVLQKEQNSIFSSHNLLSQLNSSEGRYAIGSGAPSAPGLPPAPGMQYYRDLAGNIKQGPVGYPSLRQQPLTSNNNSNLIQPPTNNNLFCHPIPPQQPQQQMNVPIIDYNAWNYPNIQQQPYPTPLGLSNYSNYPSMATGCHLSPSVYNTQQRYYSHHPAHNFESSHNLGNNNYFTTSSQCHAHPYFNQNPLLLPQHHNQVGFTGSRQPSVSGASMRSKNFKNAPTEPAIFRSKSDDTLSTVTSKPCQHNKNIDPEQKEQKKRNKGTIPPPLIKNNPCNNNNNNDKKKVDKKRNKDCKSKFRNNKNGQELLAGSSGSSSSSVAREKINNANERINNCNSNRLRSNTLISERNVNDDSNPDSGFGDDHNKYKPPCPLPHLELQQQRVFDAGNNNGEKYGKTVLGNTKNPLNNNTTNTIKNSTSNNTMNNNTNNNTINNVTARLESCHINDSKNRSNSDINDKYNNDNIQMRHDAVCDSLIKKSCNVYNSNNNVKQIDLNNANDNKKINALNNLNNRTIIPNNTNNNNNSNNNSNNNINNTNDDVNYENAILNSNYFNTNNKINNNNNNNNVDNNKCGNQSTDDNSSSVISDSESVISLSCHSL